MPPRENPTARQARLGAELRKLRERAGRTAREAAGMLGTDQGKISHIESGRIGVSEERIKKLATFYCCTDQALLEALCAIARERRGQFWWDEYRGMVAPDPLNVAELEYHSVGMRIVHMVAIPGLLQIPDYTRALFRAGVGELPGEEIETRTEFRMRRKVVLDRDDPPPFEAFIHEAALRMRFGGRQVVRRQLEYLMEESERPRITVHVIPFTNEDFFEAIQPVLYANGVVPQLDTLQIDTPIGGAFLDAEAELVAYRAFFARARKVSLDPNESRQLIHHIAREL
ncbi:helix-turn-helix transcriptional regulator [Streptomyces sp. PT12]|uniref:helix-turn-helix domain-containing protein n=1 Tax=Streptomyces sp. PT12 TaxID=1510197 RepID=UPI000DE2B4A8|nr:helix-turn-helix transcriptional regulator [Streptomyces sp. PT12]RBM17786.1 transcriptional regulator [Streptomyces sp. PT12]